jgi:FkbM family methyltransferase
MNSVIRTVSSLIPDASKDQVKSRLGVPSIEATLTRMKKIGFQPGIIVDIGAYAGEFTTLVKNVFPKACVLMVEPLPGMQDELARICASDRTISLRQTLLGRQNQLAVPFHTSETASSVLGDTGNATDPSISLPMTTLDTLTVDTPFEEPDLLKLDVQGYELEVLRGGERTLASAQAVLMEVNLIEIYTGAPLIHDVIAFMVQREFRVYDVCTFYRRPLDSALWQMDLLFLSKTSPLLASRHWK